MLMAVFQGLLIKINLWFCFVEFVVYLNDL